MLYDWAVMIVGSVTVSVPIETTQRFSTGVPGLDRVLHGGLPRCSLILVEGSPGTGKTTMALQLLIQAVRAGESCLLATSAESPQQLRSIAASHGWSLDGINITGLSEPPSAEDKWLDYTLFPEAEVEIGETFDHLFSEVERVKPKLLVLDTISSLRVLAPTAAFHRRQLKRIRDFMAARDCTTVMLDEASMTEKDLRSKTLSDGIIELRQKQSSYGADRRALRVSKLRGCSYVSGSHDVTIAAGGLTVHARLVAQSFPSIVAAPAPALGSGNPQIDALVGGGLPRGSNTLITGPAGVGKSTISTLYAMAAAKCGEKCALFLFDESEESYIARSEGLGLDMRGEVEAGRIELRHLDPAQLSVGEIANLVMDRVEKQGVKLVVIDTLNGYLQSAMEEPSVILHIRELLSYLNRRQIVTIMTLTQHGIFGTELSSPMDFSFLADNVFLLRFFELDGALHKAFSIVKKRSGPHEHTIRKLTLKAGSVDVSEPLTGFTGVLTGSPMYHPESVVPVL